MARRASIRSRWIWFRWKWRLATFFDSDTRGVDIHKTFWVSPEKIVYVPSREFDIRKDKGRVVSGDWDRIERRFEDFDVYVAFKQVFQESRDWAETELYQSTLARLKRGDILWNCGDENDLRARCRGLEILYDAIRTSGYKSQLELLNSNSASDPLKVNDEVTVSIGRHGDLLFTDGAHRLSAAKLLGIKQIPIKIAVRHSEWMVLRKQLLQYARMLGGTLYQPATHPDLRDIPALHECEDRFLMIRRNMSTKRGRLLDIGANLGYFCHRFEDEGFECYAVENSVKLLYFLQRLRRSENKNFTIVSKSILEWPQVREINFDVVLALNVFHHFLKTKESYDRLTALLQNLKMKELFFEPHLQEEPQMKNAYRNYSPSQFVGFMTQFSRLKRAEVIGKAGDGRKIYRLY
jgi:hypothetical protein